MDTISTTPETTPEKPPSQEARNLAILLWIGTLFLGFLPGLLCYLMKKDDDYVTDQAKETLNWGITLMLLLIIAKILMFILIGLLIFPAALLCSLIFCVMGAVACSDGKRFRAPFAIRLIQ